MEDALHAFITMIGVGFGVQLSAAAWKIRASVSDLLFVLRKKEVVRVQKCAFVSSYGELRQVIMKFDFIHTVCVCVWRKF